MSTYNEFDIYLDPQDNSTPESEADEDIVYISLDPDKTKHKAKMWKPVIF